MNELLFYKTSHQYLIIEEEEEEEDIIDEDQELQHESQPMV